MQETVIKMLPIPLEKYCKSLPDTKSLPGTKSLPDTISLKKDRETKKKKMFFILFIFTVGFPGAKMIEDWLLQLFVRRGFETRSCRERRLGVLESFARNLGG